MLRLIVGNIRLSVDVPWWRRHWYEWHQLSEDRRHPLSIAFAFVATHNHFVLDRGGKVFNRSAPVIKLPEGATEDDHLALLGVLNSSTACFWLKQNSHDKGSRRRQASGYRRPKPGETLSSSPAQRCRTTRFRLTLPLERGASSIAGAGTAVHCAVGCVRSSAVPTAADSDCGAGGI